MPTQHQLFYEASRRIGERDRAVMDMLNDEHNPMTPAELLRLAESKPERYGRYLGLAKRLLAQD